jgi:hypothetical protein
MLNGLQRSLERRTGKLIEILETQLQRNDGV